MSENREMVANKSSMSPIKDHQQSKRDNRPSKPKPPNPIEEAVKTWLSSLPAEFQETVCLKAAQLLSLTPKRWVVYPPMVLLPPGSFGEEWWAILGSRISSGSMAELWKLLLDGISKREGKGILTHLAVNSGIPLTKEANQSSDGKAVAKEKVPTHPVPISVSENILRTPSGLIMLYGDFGPALRPDQRPSEKDFQEALWVSTKQNGITQVWAPRYTMFSRGNVKEKARILDFHKPGDTPVTWNVSEKDLSAAVAVDLYAGIGYFVFSYAKMGLGQVVGWELNPWSVEGLRRGAIANGWSVRVVKEGEDVKGLAFNEKIVVFLEDNMRALNRIRFMETGVSSETHETGRVMHVNCGLLPTSELSWEMALRILPGDGWLHLHENVGVDDIQTRKVEIRQMLEKWLVEAKEDRRVKMEHVERVKTFAPGVWHCVFDVYLTGQVG